MAHKGEPAVFFSKEDIVKLAAPYKFAVVGSGLLACLDSGDMADWCSQSSTGWELGDLASYPLESRLESVSDHSVFDFVSNGQWNQNLLRYWVPDAVVAEIIQRPVPTGDGQDRAIWCLTESGDFSIASTYHLSSGQQPTSFMFARVWYPLLPVKISFSMMRVLRNRLPVASALGRLNVHGPSKRFCCLDPNSESLKHIFSEGDLAQFLWAFFGNAVGVVYRGTGVWSRLVGWWSLPTLHSRMKMIHTVLPSIIYWHVWLARNLAFFEGQSLHKRTICDCIMADAVGLVCGRDRGNRRVICPGMLFMPVSLDGALDTPIGWFVGNHQVTSLQAEAKSLIYGVQQCVLRGFSSIQVEVDSLLLANILQGKSKCSWLIRSEIATFQAICTLARTVGHCYREANQVADALAKAGANGSGNVLYTSQSELPRPAKGALILDKAGTPAIRVRAIRK
nr:uncharacterized protein LOC113708336 [Coffea arabica]